MNDRNSNQPPPLDILLELASGHEPDLVPRPGFETRLRARIRELREQEDALGAVFPIFSKWLWRTSLGLTPVAALLALFFALVYGIGLPEGADSLLWQFSEWIPTAAF